MPQTQMPQTVVLKFGGTSVSSLARWQTIADQIRQRRSAGESVVVVCSALSGVSDLLERLLPAAKLHTHATILDALTQKHHTLATALGVGTDAIDAVLGELSRIAQGVSLIGEASPRLTARVMAQGELMSTRLGADWLVSQGVAAKWMDARQLLVSRSEGPPARRYLSARCEFDRDADLIAALAPHPVVLTQGFIARDDAGDTVLLGRGGSDTSATTFAARLGAVRCEIWTDVPGMFTANPRQVPTARLIAALDYAEAQEIASTGAKVLHPAAVAPCQRAGIPLHIRSTPHPDLPGTVISDDAASRSASVKAISARRGITLVSMETVGMWQQVGFLADVFGCFKTHGLSVDLVSTSETNVTISLDGAANDLSAAILAELCADLSAYCQPGLIDNCASVSIVGRNIRGVLHRLAPALEVFEEHRIHLVSQAASDLNLTVVVDESQAERLVSQLHAQLFAHSHGGAALGPSWQAMFAREITEEDAAWWMNKREMLIEIAGEDSPVYVYDGATIDARAAEVVGIADRALYAVKANNHPEVLRRIHAGGLGFECVSPEEVRRVLALFPDLDPAGVLFTPNFAPREDYEAGFALGVQVTLDNLHPLSAWPELFAGREVFIRIDPGQGRGHHAHVRTAGASSKFGISFEQLDALEVLVEAAGCTVVGLHAHAGSGIRTPDNWREVGTTLAPLARRFPNVRVIDVGGGLGVPEKPGQSRLDLTAVAAGLDAVRKAWPGLSIWVEPGRYLVAEAGVLLGRVTQLKEKGAVRYVGVDTGMHHLIRPALYGAFHRIVNLSRYGEAPGSPVNIVGPICETGDVIGHDRRIPTASEGDVLLIATAGAYGAVMSSDYNLRSRAREVVI
ncbi:MAG: diaminopimelate decarboxylase/aspartate kinase [Myxococcota bacterium]|jgi:diaminopimelate decarboxylase/aspartate kinase